MKKCNKASIRRILTVVLSSLLLITGCSSGTKDNKTATNTENKTTETQKNQPVNSSVDDKGYKLVESVVLSRHNVRAPLSTKGSDLYKMTPHKWVKWSSGASELSSLGGTLKH